MINAPLFAQDSTAVERSGVLQSPKGFEGYGDEEEETQLPKHPSRQHNLPQQNHPKHPARKKHATQIALNLI